MYKPLKLNYSDNALEPFLSAYTVNTHYHEHYLKYLNNLNILLDKYDLNLKDIAKNIDMFPITDRDDILYNVGGVLNHELYFNNMSPLKNTEPKGKLKKAIDDNFGDFENFKQEFIKTANYLVGSGYTFLILNDNKLEIINLSNQETPYSYNLIPLIALDLWEHAYYLDYQNDRKNYILNFFEIIDFDRVLELYEKNI